MTLGPKNRLPKPIASSPPAASRLAPPPLATGGCAAWVLLLIGLLGWGCRPPATSDSAFVQFMNVGKNYYDKGEALKAIPPFQQAVALQPTQPDAQLNLANACLLAGQPENALRHAEEAVKLDPNLAAAHYVAGCAHLRLRQFEPALKAFQIAKDLEPTVGATTLQLGRTHQELGHWDEAIAAFEELLSFEPDHPVANYALSQVLVRAGRAAEANEALQRHRKILETRTGTMDVAKVERCVHTQARAPFILEQPSASGIAVTFADVTDQVLPPAADYHGPLGVIDFNHDDRNSLFVLEGAQNFRLLVNSNGTFQPHPQTLPRTAGAQYHRCLVADLQNDRLEDVLMVGDRGCHVFKFATNAQITETSAFSRLAALSATDGALVDLDFTGKLDLLALNATHRALEILRNLGNLYYLNVTATSGLPSAVTGATRIAIEDWNNDDLLDVVLARPGQPPQLLLKTRGGPLVLTNSPPDWPAGGVIALNDFNNDLRADLFVATPDRLECVLNGVPQHLRLAWPDGARVVELLPLDYDNDGWLDILVAGDGLRVWRNLGQAGFRDATAALGLDKLGRAPVEAIVAADFDRDGDTDLAVSFQGQGLRLLRNQGGNANLQVKVRLIGQRSNSSGIGTRVEVTTGGLRLGRRAMTLPIEIGVGQHAQLESLNARWLNLSLNNVDVKVDPRTSLPLLELALPEGSCPYLYAWDGRGFRFVTDLLGASPLGLRVAADRFVEADPDEYVWLGDESRFVPRGEDYLLQITEELREVLYLDAAHLVVVDHPPGTEVHPTSKMVPSRPFPPHEILTLHHPHPLRRAVRSDGLDVTEALQEADARFASPIQPRIPQLRGLAEPWAITLDFGPLPVDRPLVLAITAWLRFGGGMANVAASQHPDLPFPFPALEVETATGAWQAVDVVVGTPAGKTKNMVVDLTGKLPAGSRRLRLGTAYELHWDRIALLEKASSAPTRLTRLLPDSAHLHWRGFSEFEDWPWYLPLTPNYERVSPNPKWRITPMGWCTRYGGVRELVEQRDNALALLNGGDELTLRFAAPRLPPKPAGQKRDFFLYTCGWDKDSDFHCEKGWLVEPLPWHGLEDQRYGQQPRPPLPGDGWIQQYNTRWVGLHTLQRPVTSERVAAR